MRILLMGHPNVGKSVLFNRLTGANATESNYPGTTVDYTKGYMRLGKKEVEVIDVPGTFSLDAKDKAEEVASRMLTEHPDAVVICVLDSTKVERGLYLALELIEEERLVVIALNMWDVAMDKRIQIDTEEMERILGVPVVATIAISGEGIKELVSRVEDASTVEVEAISERVGGEVE